MGPGKVTLHAELDVGMNSPVLGVASNCDSDVGCAPSARPSAVVQRWIVVLPLGTSVTVNWRDAGKVRQAVCPVTSPRSSDQNPPGVLG